MTDEIPRTTKQGKYTLHLTVGESGRPILRTLHQAMKFREHYEAKGYLTSTPNRATKTSNGVKYFATYRSENPLSHSEQQVMISQMGGKMKGVGAISTSPLRNEFCRKQSQCGSSESICRNCYSMAGLLPGGGGKKPAAHETSIPGLARNTRLLSKEPIENIPKINTPFFRFNAEGELVNEIHMINLMKIAKANPNTHFTLWTKRPDIVARAMAMVRKPSNLHLIRSSPMMNHPVPLPPGFDKVFTVFTPEFIEKNKVKINCGARSCVNCKLCYTNNATHIVNERLKSNSRLIGKMP